MISSIDIVSVLIENDVCLVPTPRMVFREMELIERCINQVKDLFESDQL